MTKLDRLQPADVDVPFVYPTGLDRAIEQGLTDLAPWHIMDREAALLRMRGMRDRYSSKYIPFARRKDNDDVACIDPARDGRVVIVHDFASEGFELRREFPSFWDWFRAAIDDMIDFE